MTAIAQALEAFRPVIADRYAKQVRYSFNQMVERLGPSLKNVGNSWEFARSWSATVRRYVDFKDGVAAINEDRLAQGAAEYAEASSQEWLTKFQSKLGNVEFAEVRSRRGALFVIVGRRNGHSVAIEQDMIVKSSTKGKLFNQFPSRIYVDGYFTPEKKYHAMFR